MLGLLGIPLGMVVGNGVEWWVHKHWLHERGRKKGTFWSFHWHEHHRNCRLHDHVDPEYEGVWKLAWNAQSKEAAALLAGGLALLPLFPVFPFFVGTLWAWGMNYYRVHKRAHLDPDWAREHLPWHYDHHMGPNQDCNWGVTYPWWDWVLGTRVVYLGTEKEKADRARRHERLAAKAAASAVAK
jgi:sterol desaturase/sphingolipid hydroxylase (fatty acid hydroxylase superfamily)